jgi:hypothetical protein
MLASHQEHGRRYSELLKRDDKKIQSPVRRQTQAINVSTLW